MILRYYVDLIHAKKNEQTRRHPLQRNKIAQTEIHRLTLFRSILTHPVKQPLHLFIFTVILFVVSLCRSKTNITFTHYGFCQLVSSGSQESWNFVNSEGYKEWFGVWSQDSTASCVRYDLSV